MARCGSASGKTEYVEGVKLRLMQPNLPQDAKFKPENGPAILSRYLELSDRAVAPGRSGVADATHIIWPESAFPFILSRDPDALARIAATMRSAVLVTGAARVEDDLRREDGRRRTKIFNSILAVQNGRIVAAYDKIHLVPFGEYLPLSKLLAPLGVTQLVPGTWTRGPAHGGSSRRACRSPRRSSAMRRSFRARRSRPPASGRNGCSM